MHWYVSFVSDPLFLKNLFLRQHLYYQFLVYFRVVENHAQCVKCLHRVDVNIDFRTTIRRKERHYKVCKSRDREPSRIIDRKIFKSMKKRTGRLRKISVHEKKK